MIWPWTLTSSSSEPASPGSSPPPSSPTAGKRVVLVDQEPRAVPRRPGVLVASAGCSSSTAPSSAGWASRTRLELAPQDWFGSAQFDRRRGLLAAPVGRGLRRTSRPARSGPGCTSRATGSSPSSAGPSAATAAPTGTATRCRASTSPGAPGPGSSSRSSAGSAPRSTRAASSFASGTASTSSSSPGGVVTGVRGRGARAERRRPRRPSPAARRSATSRSRRRPSS